MYYPSKLLCKSLAVLNIASIRKCNLGVTVWWHSTISTLAACLERQRLVAFQIVNKNKIFLLMSYCQLSSYRGLPTEFYLEEDAADSRSLFAALKLTHKLCLGWSSRKLMQPVCRWYPQQRSSPSFIYSPGRLLIEEQPLFKCKFTPLSSSFL